MKPEDVLEIFHASAAGIPGYDPAEEVPDFAIEFLQKLADRVERATFAKAADITIAMMAEGRGAREVARRLQKMARPPAPAAPGEADAAT